MADVLYTAPASEPLTLDEAKEHLNVTITEDDVKIAAMIVAAREYCENYQNRILITQTRERWLDDWPGDYYIELKSPLASVTYVKYYGTDNTEYTMAAADYFVDTKGFIGKVGLAYGKVWPSITLRPFNGIVVRYICGSTTVEETIKQAMKLAIQLNYDSLRPDEAKQIANTRDVLLSMNRVVPV